MNSDTKSPAKPDTPPQVDQTPAEVPASPKESVKEIGGRKGPEPTRYGDWENGGKCVDF